MRALLIYLVAAALPPLILWYTAAPERRADFRFAVGAELNTLDPQRMSWLHDIRIAECLFEPLVRMRLPDMQVEPGAAARWAVSNDGLTYTFHLRPEARWSNGDPLVASDFLYAWQRAILPDFAADYAQLLFCIEGAEAFFNFRVEQLKQYGQRPQRDRTAAVRLWEVAKDRFRDTVGIRAGGPNTLVVTLSHRTPYFIELCAFATFMPVNERSVEQFVDFDPGTGMRRHDTQWIKPQNLVCNGPFGLARWRFKRDLLLVENEHYWNRQNLGVRSIQQRVIDSPVTQWLAYRSGELDWLPGVPTTDTLAADLVASGRSDVHLVPGAGTYFYNFNCSKTFLDGRPNPLSDARVRQALSMAIDRQTIVEKVTRLGQPVARTFVPVGALSAYEPPVEAGVTFDPQIAVALLAAAGHPDGAGLTDLSIMYNTGHGHEKIAQAIKSMWKQHLGVVVTLEGVEGRKFGARLKKHDYSISRAGWFGDYRDPTTFLDKFLTSNGNNDAAWSNEAFDRLLRVASTEADPESRMELLANAEHLMLGEQPIAPIYQYVSLHVYDARRVQNLWPNPWHLRRLEKVKVAVKVPIR